MGRAFCEKFPRTQIHVSVFCGQKGSVYVIIQVSFGNGTDRKAEIQRSRGGKFVKAKKLKQAKIAIVAGVVALALCVVCYCGILYAKHEINKESEYFQMSISDMKALADRAFDYAKEYGFSEVMSEDYGTQLLLLCIALKIRIPTLIIGLALLGIGAFLRLQANTLPGGSTYSPVTPSANSATTRCPHCGKVFAGKAGFCPSCGKEIAAKAPAAPAAPQQVPEESKPVTAPSAGEATENRRGVTCPQCGKVYPTWQNFCTSCGSDLPKESSAQPAAPAPAQPEFTFCPDCGRKNPAGAKFCAGCGRQL